MQGISILSNTHTQHQSSTGPKNINSESTDLPGWWRPTWATGDVTRLSTYPHLDADSGVLQPACGRCARLSSLATRVCTNRRRNASSPLAASQRRAVHHTTTARGEPSARRHLASAPQVCVPYTNDTESVISEHSHTHGRTHAHTGAAVVRATHAGQQKVWRSRAPPTRVLLTVWRRYPGCTRAQSELTHVSW